MAPKPKLSEEQAIAVKSDIWNEMKNEEIAFKYGISCPTVVNIKAGRQYYSTPWPNGVVGAMPDHQREKAANSKRFDTKVNKAWDRWDNTNERYYPTGIHPQTRANLDAMAVERGFANFGEMSAFQANKRHEEEQRRHAEALEEYRRTQAKYEEARRTGDYSEFPSLAPRPIIDQNGPVNPSLQECVPWPKVLELAGNIVVVAAAESADDQDLKDAISIVFAQTPPSAWAETYVLGPIMNLKERISVWRSE